MDIVFYQFVALDDHGHAAMIGRVRAVAADLESMRAVAAGLSSAITRGIHTCDHVLIVGHGIDPNSGEERIWVSRADTASKDNGNQ